MFHSLTSYLYTGDDSMIKGACYIRVSTDNQLENYSIEEQTSRLRAYCQAKDIHIVNLYTDGGYSGGNTNRPALQQMLDDIASGLIDTVVVYKLDRLSRSQKDTLMLIEDQFLSKQVNFISINENFDTSTPFGRAMIGILSVFAQLEKDQITERFTMGRIGRAKNGYFHGGGYAPTGYDYIDGALVINEYEAMQVRELYHRFLQGYSVYNCWQYMQSTYTTKYGTWNSDTLVRSILQNELYTGKVKFKGAVYPGNHQPIISPELFRQVQDRFKQEHQVQTDPVCKRTPFRTSTLLSSLIHCGKCGARFHGEHGNYSCYSRTKGDKKYIIDPNCKNKKWKIPELNALVTNCLSQLDFTELKPPQASSSPNSACINRLNHIHQQIDRLVDLYQISSIPIETISQKIESLTREKKALQNASETAIQKSPPHTITAAKDVFLSLMETGSLEEKRACLTLLIDKIVITDEDVNIILKQM